MGPVPGEGVEPSWTSFTDSLPTVGAPGGMNVRTAWYMTVSTVRPKDRMLRRQRASRSSVPEEGIHHSHDSVRVQNRTSRRRIPCMYHLRVALARFELASPASEARRLDRYPTGLFGACFSQALDLELCSRMGPEGIEPSQDTKPHRLRVLPFPIGYGPVWLQGAESHRHSGPYEGPGLPFPLPCKSGFLCDDSWSKARHTSLFPLQ